MARWARVVVAGVPHQVTQRCVGRRRAFLSEGDYARYVELLTEGCRRARVAVWAYCLLPREVHLILVPSDPDGLRAALGETHRRYAREMNARSGRRGLLWRSRFASFPVDERWLLAAARYVELAPVREGLAESARQWRWSSARAHLRGRGDGLVAVRPLLALARRWSAFLRAGLGAEEERAIEGAARTGRPLGTPGFVRQLERRLRRSLARQKPGPRPGGRRRARKTPRRSVSRRARAR